MAPVTAQRVPDAMAGHNRDVADLCKDALKTYKGIVGFDLERKFENVEAMIIQGIKEMQNFHKFRHDDKKVDKLRGLFLADLDYIEKGAQYLGGARKKMDLRIRRLREATELAILGNTEEIQKMTPELRKDQHSHTAMHEEQMQVMSVVRDTTENIHEDMAKLLRAFDDQKREQSKPRGSGEQKVKPFAAEYSKHPSVKGIRKTLVNVEGEDHEYHMLQETTVPDTCAWLFREPEWERWLNQQDPPDTVLAITGSPGTGKSHLAFSVYQALKSEEANKDASRRTCVAQFVFNQVAEQSPELCEAMYAEIVRDQSQINQRSSDDLLRKFLGVAFGKDSKGCLFLVFDGIDEIADNDLTLFQHFSNTIEEGSQWHELEKAHKASQSDDLYQDGKLPIKFRERSLRGFFREEPVAPNNGHRPRRPEAHRQTFLTCCNFIQPEHPGIKSTGQGVREYAVNHVLHHWRDIEAEHLNVEQQTEVIKTFASLMLDKSSFTRIQEEELKITFFNDERFKDALFDRLRSWAVILLDVKVSLSTEAVEWWSLVAERPRDCLLQLAKSHVRRLQDAVDMNTAEASFLAANGALKIAVIRAAVESGEVAFVVQMYQDSIRLLDNVNASAPFLVELGFLHIDVTRDPEAARTVFDQALDSGSTGWSYAVTGESPEATLDTANTFQSEVLYRLFRGTSDVKRKRELLGEVERLLIRPLALDMPPISDNALLYRQIVLARMYLKLGPAETFHHTLQCVVGSCVAALSHNVG
ncbi:hypothetical protein K4K58_012411 [Colletotrichum sp. SAR11_239]|nr:hypothetical protein K4K58_012411 [Colletotrichum sp. SAR11_239]